MKAILQRVSEARVRIDGDIVGKIGAGLMILYCAEAGDGDDAVQRLAEKTAKLRIFADDAGKMNKAITDIGGSALVVSQFTLAANTAKGNRPSFVGAAARTMAPAFTTPSAPPSRLWVFRWQPAVSAPICRSS